VTSEKHGIQGQRARRRAVRIALALLLGMALTPSRARALYKELIDVPLDPQRTEEWCWAASGEMIFTYFGRPDIAQCEEANVEFGRADCCGSQSCSSDLDCTPPGAASCTGDSDCVPSGAPSCKTDSDCTNNEICAGNKCSPNRCKSNLCTSQLCRGAVAPALGQCLPADCVHGGHTQFSKWNFDSTSTACGTGLSFAAFQAQINSKRPVEFAWSFMCKDSTHASCYHLCGTEWVSGGHVLVAVGYWVDSSDPTTQMVVINDPWPPNVGKKRMLSYDDWINTLPAMGGHTTQSHVYDIKNDLATSCPAGQEQGGAGCCPLHDACGAACCDAGDPPPNEDCGDQACPILSSCVNTQVGLCCGFDQVGCGGECCPAGFSCEQGACCSPERSCGSICCAEGQACQNGQCTQLSCGAGNSACVFDPGQPAICCPSSVTCCNGQCCQSGQMCCEPGGPCQDISACLK
jgi:hypothetical protein